MNPEIQNQIKLRVEQTLQESETPGAAIAIYTSCQPFLSMGIGYGLGLCLSVDSPYGKVAGHNGAGPGYSVAAYHFPNLLENSMTFVALANRDRHDLDLGLTIIFRIIRTLERFTDRLS